MTRAHPSALVARFRLRAETNGASAQITCTSFGYGSRVSSRSLRQPPTRAHHGEHDPHAHGQHGLRVITRIGIAGDGPAGLYFALLVKRRNPSHVIRVIEQNPADATFGFGVVFSDRALGFLEEADPESYRDIERRLQTWDDQAIVHRDQEVRIDGLGFSGIARLELLQIPEVRGRT